MNNTTDLPIQEPIEYLYVYYTLSDIGENLDWNYSECNFPDGWNITGTGVNEYKINEVSYKLKEQHSIPASKKNELFDKLLAFFEHQYENGLVTRFSISL
jgi:hypothetical protein